MSVYAMEKFVFTLKKSSTLQAQFKTDPDAALADFPLTDMEHKALRDGDLPTLYKMGVHPLLLAPYSRFMRISRPDYQKQLDPLRGIVKMRS
jgi:hypothetical protein